MSPVINATLVMMAVGNMQDRWFGFEYTSWWSGHGAERFLELIQWKVRLARGVGGKVVCNDRVCSPQLLCGNRGAIQHHQQLTVCSSGKLSSAGKHQYFDVWGLRGRS